MENQIIKTLVAQNDKLTECIEKLMKIIRHVELTHEDQNNLIDASIAMQESAKIQAEIIRMKI